MITLNAFLIFAPLPGFIRFSSKWTLFTSGLIKQAKKNPNINGIKIVRNFPITANTTRDVVYIDTATKGDKRKRYDTSTYEMLSIYVLNAASGQSFHLETASLNANGSISIVYDSSNLNETVTIILRALFRKL